MLDPQILGRGSAFEAHGQPDGVTVLPSSDRHSWKNVTLVDAFRCHWTDYLKEAAGLIAFMLGAGTFTTLFQFPGSPVREAMPSALSRNIGLEIIMSGVTAAIIYSPWGKKSGAHINPAVTWAFYRLGRINRSDALFYTLFQFVGGTIAPIVLFG